MSLASQLHKVPVELREAYMADLPNINFLRQKWQVIGKDAAANAKANGHLFTREMRPIEVQIINYLVPATKYTDKKEGLKAWKWVMAQDWGREFSGLPMEKRFH